MVYTLRSAGVPARMVTGYQGGSSLNERVLQIRQYDAHAWVEALINGVWRRYDPTSMVAPSRLTFGLEQALEELGESRNTNILDGLEKSAFFAAVQTWFQQLDYSWSKWVLGFDNAAQTSMLEDLLGTITPEKMRAVFLSALGLIGLILAFYFLPISKRESLPYSYRIMLKAVKLVELHTGIKREHKTLSDYRYDVSPVLNSEAAVAFDQVCELFERENYAIPNTEKRTELVMKEALNTLKKAIK